MSQLGWLEYMSCFHASVSAAAADDDDDADVTANAAASAAAFSFGLKDNGTVENPSFA